VGSFSIDPQIVSQDLLTLLIFTVLVVAFFFTRKKYEPRESILILSLYIVFVIYKVISQVVI
jgi:Ca2+/Na+ antiporter